MTKLTEFETKISSISLYALIVCAIVTFLIFAVFSIDFYADAYRVRFGNWGIMIAILVGVIHELVRFALLLTSMRDFIRSNIFVGIIGLIASFLLVAYDIRFAFRIAELWSNPDFAFEASDYFSSFIYDVVIGLVLEIRLVLTLFKRDTTKANLKPSLNGKKYPSFS